MAVVPRVMPMSQHAPGVVHVHAVVPFAAPPGPGLAAAAWVAVGSAPAAFVVPAAVAAFEMAAAGSAASPFGDSIPVVVVASEQSFVATVVAVAATDECSCFLGLEVGRIGVVGTCCCCHLILDCS